MTDGKTRVLHLVGSPESDFYADLSRLYARDCLQSVSDPDRFEMHIAYVAPGGSWSFPLNLEDSGIAEASPKGEGDALNYVRRLSPDVVVPQMFCVPGMTEYRALIESMGIPLVGNRSDVMARAADKDLARRAVAVAGVRVPDGQVMRPGERPIISPPAVVKPVDSDNSLGIGFVAEPSDWESALDSAFAHSKRVLVERYVELGREVRCGVIEWNGELVPLPLEEYAMDPVDKPIRGAADKLARRKDGEMRLVAKEGSRAWIVPRSDPATEAAHRAALLCYEALGCRQYGLFDFRIDPEGNVFFLEAGLYCSYARQSVIVMMASGAGIDLPELFAAAVRSAIRG